MSSLKSRLNRLQGKKTSDESVVSVNITDSDSGVSADSGISVDNVVSADNRVSTLDEQEPYASKWRALDISLMENEFGSFLLRKRVYDKSYFHGMHQLQEWSVVAPHLNAFFPEHNSNAEQFLFLDLETTGLGSGAGNIPFMVGLAYWREETFIVEQALIRHPAEERAMLAYLHRLCAHYTHLISYNGKSFDWPLMISRFVINGMREKMWEPLHIDFLHPARSLWRNTLESCRLSHIEEMRLGITRIDDVPGSQAPTLYFEFLTNGNPDIISGVFQHNEVDMLSLVTLSIRFGWLLSETPVNDIVQQPTHPEEMVRTGLWLEKMGHTTYSEQLFELVMHVPKTASNTLMMLAARDKKMGNYSRAIMLWEKIVANQSGLPKKDELEALIELSMYYEHKRKELEKAYHYAQLAYELALELARFMSSKKKNSSTIMNDLVKRMDRIRRKMKKASVGVF